MMARWMFGGLGWLAVVFITVGFRPPDHDPLPNLDKRIAAPVAVEKQQAAAHLRALAPDGTVTFDPLTSSAAHVTATRGFLSGPAGQGRAIGAAALNAFDKNDPHRTTKAFLREHRTLFGHGPEALGGAKVKRDYTAAHNGLHTTVWQQEVDGLPVFEGLLISHVTARGELVSVSSRFAADTARQAQLGGVLPAINAAEAAQRAGENLDVAVVAADITLLEKSPGVAQHHRFQISQLAGETTVEMVWLPMGDDKLRLCWEVILKPRTRGEVFRVLVDAVSGEVLLRRCLTDYLTNATYRVFTGDSPTPFSPGHPTPLSTQPAEVARPLVTLAALSTNASPSSWMDASVNETRGNNVDAHLDRNDDDLADLPRPQGSPYHVFDYALDLTASPTSTTSFQNAAVANLFYWNNWMHDQLYDLGFTEAAGNFQVNNFGRGGFGNDAVQADAQDGGGFNNANFYTPPDGVSPRMQMFLFSGPTPDRDGDYDVEVILHEYAHGLTGRRVGGGAGINALQSRGLGEGWSDFYALALLSQPSDSLNGNYAFGAYVAQQFLGLEENYYYGIRRYPYSTNFSTSPHTFRDIDPTQADTHASVPVSPVLSSLASEVHNQGEIWCAALWDARANLINKLGFTNGNRLILQLVTDALPLTPANPNFIHARDAVIQADQINNGGTNRMDLWAAFARRGMGANASAPDSSTTIGVVESYDLPDNLQVNPAFTFTASGLVGGPFNTNAQIFTLRNYGSNLFTWSGASAANWLTITPASGTLATGATVSLTIALNTNATLLNTGLYSGLLRFTNLTSGIAQSRTVTLRVAQPDYFSELFAGNFDLSYSTFTFTPDASSSSYSVCRTVAAAFPTDPSGGNVLVLTDDSFEPVTLSGTNHVRLYARSTNVVFIGSNGYLTLNQGSTEYSESFASHFQLPRLSGLFRDLNPENGGTISWLQMSNRLVVTYQGVPEYVAPTSNNFQFELFFDGRIRLTYLQMGASYGLAGLSAGGGGPTGFEQSNLSGYLICADPPVVTIHHAGITAVISFSTVAGRSYRVETNSVIGGSWSSAGPDINATGSSCAITNSLGGPEKFYRVRLLP